MASTKSSALTAYVPRRLLCSGRRDFFSVPDAGKPVSTIVGIIFGQLNILKSFQQKKKKYRTTGNTCNTSKYWHVSLGFSIDVYRTARRLSFAQILRYYRCCQFSIKLQPLFPGKKVADPYEVIPRSVTMAL